MKADDWAREWGDRIRDRFNIGDPWLRPEGDVGPAAMTDLMWNNGKAAEVAPAFQPHFRAFLAAVDSVSAAHGTDLIAWYGVRRLETQLEKYRQGRTTPGKIVTKTIASLHLFGMAVDLCVRTSKGQPSFTLPGWYRTEILPLAAAHGLRSLFLAKGIDLPHIEVPPADRPASVVATMRELKETFPGLTA